MLSNWWLTTLSYFEIIGLLSILAVMIRRRMIRRWPSVFVAIITELAADLVLMSLIGRRGLYPVYFYIYWGSSILHACLRLWIMADVARSFPGIRVIPANINFAVVCLGMAMAGASGFYCYLNHPTIHAITPAQLVLAFVSLFNHCVNIAWASFVVVMLAAAKLFNLAWNPEGARFASCAVARICISVVVAELLSFRSPDLHKVRQIRLFANGLDSVGSIVVFAFWIYFTFKLTHPSTQEDRPRIGDLRTLLNLSVSRER